MCKFNLILISIVILSFNSIVYSQWQWVHPKPTGNGYRWCKMWDANNWYAVGNGGTFIKTSNAGATWFTNLEAGTFVPGYTYSDIWDAHFFNTNTGIVVGVIGMGKTTNGGVNFDSIPGTNYGGIFTWFGVYFLDNNTGYASGYQTLVKTTNGGDTWSPINSITQGIEHYDIYTPNDTLILVSSGLGNVQRSTNGGASWTEINTGSSGYLYKMKFINKDTGFVAGTSNAVSLTTNGGLNWVLRSPPIADSWNDIDFKKIGGIPTAYLTGNNYYILKSTDLGITWDTLKIYSSIQSSFDDFRSAEVSNSGDTILAVGDNGAINIRYSENNIEQLTYNVKLQASNYDVWAESGNGKVWVVGAPETPGSTFDQVLYSPDGGNTWTSQSTINSSATFYSISMLDVNTGYIAGSGGEVMKTTNGGVNWVPLNTPTSDVILEIDFVNANTGWIFGKGSVLYKSTNGGGNWILQTSVINTNTRGGISMVNENTGWIVGKLGSNAIVCKTTNGGTNWINQNVSTPSEAFSDIKMFDANTGYLSGAGVVMKTTNGGVNWTSLPVPFLQQFLGIDLVDAQSISVSYLGNSTIHSFDGGQSWNFCYGVASWNYTKLDMVSKDTIFYAGYGAGVFKKTDVLTGVITQWQNTNPEKYELLQNYPNPFNPKTTIEFSIPKAGEVTLKVYDITGREVKTLVNGLNLNPGTMKHAFDGSNLSSGIYFYSLFVDNKIIGSKKMLLIK